MAKRSNTVNFRIVERRGNEGGKRLKRPAIEKTCQLALDDGCDFAWVNTCCIDKASSAELTEAINSMFPWYAGSEVCYTYLADYDASDPNAEMSQSRWFTRGWTLQELIAPARVLFYDKSWNPIGTKDVLSQQLSLITGVGQEVLLASKHRSLKEILDQLPIARKMSWAAKRETTRIEDIAYCLLGIFGINLPLLYGEGERAFIRLQEEVVKNSNDLSLFAWLSPKDETFTNLDRNCGVFAQHPREFQASDKLALINDNKFTPDFTITNKGLKIHAQLYYDRSENLQVLGINCHDVACPQKTLGIFLRHQGASIFARARPHLFALIDSVGPMNPIINPVTENRSFFLSKSIAPSIDKSLHRVHRCSFVIPRYEDEYCYFVAAKPEALWDSNNGMFITIGLQDFVGCHEYSFRKHLPGLLGPNFTNRRDGERFFVVFGFGYGFAPWVRILSFFEPLHDEIKRGNWRQVACATNSVTGECLDFAEYLTYRRKNRWRRCICVKLEQGVQGGEPVYSIRLGNEIH